MRAYFYLARAQWLTALMYRFDMVMSIIANSIIMLAGVYLWQAAYQSADASVNVSAAQMITYVLIATLLNACFNSTVEFTLQNRIAQGDIAVDMVRPMNVLVSFLAVDLGLSVSALVTRLIPLFLIGSLLFRPPLPASWLHFLLFLISAFMGYLILWMFSALIALVCLWHVKMGDFGAVKDGFIILLSGRIIPAWFLPEPLQKIMAILPFQHIYQTPLSLYIGQIQPSAAMQVLVRELEWTMLLVGIVALVWHRGKSRLQMLGG